MGWWLAATAGEQRQQQEEGGRADEPRHAQDQRVSGLQQVLGGR
jgi:hypothetical protein